MSPKIGVILKTKLIWNWSHQKMLFYKKCGPEMIFFNEKNFLERFFDIEIWLFECPNFKIFDATVLSQRYRYQKHILQWGFDFFAKMKLVSNVAHINATMLTWLLLVQNASLSEGPEWFQTDCIYMSLSDSLIIQDQFYTIQNLQRSSIP